MGREADKSIGVFDSGVGGLTIIKEIMKLLPGENVVYFGDTARVPYGPRSSETITKYTFQSINFLLEQDIKAIVIACNTASARSLKKAQERYNIPILGVIKPGAKAAVESTLNNRIGVIGTEGTINSNAYTMEMSELDAGVSIFTRACPLFVPIVEEGWSNTDVAKLTAQAYLSEFNERDIDTLVLGCTHYPLLEETIGKVLKKPIRLVNPAIETARVLKEMLEDRGLLREGTGEGSYKYFVSDRPNNFSKVGERFLNREIRGISLIEIQRY